MKRSAVTLLEMLIAIVLLSVIVLGLTSMDFFSRYQVVDSDRRAKIQNKLYLTLEHINRNVMGTTTDGGVIGNEAVFGLDSMVDVTAGVGSDEVSRIKFFVDSDSDGLRETTDDWMGYRYYDSTASPASKRRTLQYCSRCANQNCVGCPGNNWVQIADKITSFIPEKDTTKNYVTLTITACFDPANEITTAICGDRDNPQVTMSTRIKIPSGGTN